LAGLVIINDGGHDTHGDVMRLFPGCAGAKSRDG
jgi:hypothetical protein